MSARKGSMAPTLSFNVIGTALGETLASAIVDVPTHAGKLRRSFPGEAVDL